MITSLPLVEEAGAALQQAGWEHRTSPRWKGRLLEHARARCRHPQQRR